MNETMNADVGESKLQKQLHLAAFNGNLTAVKEMVTILSQKS